MHYHELAVKEEASKNISQCDLHAELKAALTNGCRVRHVSKHFHGPWRTLKDSRFFDWSMPPEMYEIHPDDQDKPALPQEVKSLGQVLLDNLTKNHLTLHFYSNSSIEECAQAVAAEVSRQHKEDVERLNKSIEQLDAEIAKEREISGKEHDLSAHWSHLAKRRQEALEAAEARVSKAEMERSICEENAFKLQARVEELEAMHKSAIKYTEHLKEKIGNQRTRINYLEGATHHAGGTPLSIANARISDLERQLADTQTSLRNRESTLNECNQHKVRLLTERDSLRELATLRPISEAGDLAEGMIRVFVELRGTGHRWMAVSMVSASYITHFADIPLPIDASKKAEGEAAWITHDGGPCPLKDDEVEEWEYKTDSGRNSTAQYAPSGMLGNWKWRKGCLKIRAYRVLKWKPKAEPEKMVMVPLEAKDVPPGSVFRYLDWKPEVHITASLVYMNGVTWVRKNLITDGAYHESMRFKDLWSGGWQINRSIPLTGRWNPEAWEPCSKKA